jgi:hypothetical protein
MPGAGALLAALALLASAGSVPLAGSLTGPRVQTAKAANLAATAADPAAPPPVTVLRQMGRLARGLIFVTPTSLGASSFASGPEILDNQGRPVWFLPLPSGQVATDFRVQAYQERPVLTWWQGTPGALAGRGPGADYIADEHYHVIATVQAGNGQQANGHEFQLTQRGTALITIYKPVTADVSAVGGPKDQQIFEGAVQEIDVRTGKVLFEWDSIGHVPFTESYTPLPASAATSWDYFHINSVHLDTDGNLLISAQHTQTIYKVSRRTGGISWRLGGKDSSFALGPGVRFASQHDPVALSPDTIQLFDSQTDGPPVLPYSRVITVRLNVTARTATLVSSIKHPDNLSAPSGGDGQALPGGHVFVGWGQLGRYSEFAADGTLLYDATFPRGNDSYRAFRYRWKGSPAGGPTATGQPDGSGAMIHAIWNGATRVASWQVLGGSRPTGRSPSGRRGMAWTRRSACPRSPRTCASSPTMPRAGN